MAFEEDAAEWFGEDVRQHVGGGDMEDREFVVGDTFTHKMVTCVNMFGTGVMFWVLGESFCALIVDMERDGIQRADMEFCEEPTKPQTLLARVGESFVLGFRAGERYRGLLLGLPRDGS